MPVSRVFAAYIPVKLPVSLYTLGCPCRFGLCPFEIFIGKLYSMISPVYHIDRRKYLPFIHIEITGGIRITARIEK
jgi:hypothetical protein